MWRAMLHPLAILTIALLLGSGPSGAETRVIEASPEDPAAGLQAAVDNATAGDIVQLDLDEQFHDEEQPGLTINKSLTLAAKERGRASVAVGKITLGNDATVRLINLNIDGEVVIADAESVTLQRVNLGGQLRLPSGEGHDAEVVLQGLIVEGRIVVSGGSHVALLNSIIDGQMRGNDNSSTERLVLVGNVWNGPVLFNYSPDMKFIYVAGNQFLSDARFAYWGRGPVWFVANEMFASAHRQTAIDIGTNGPAMVSILGNRVWMRSEGDAGGAIQVLGGEVLIAANRLTGAETDLRGTSFVWVKPQVGRVMNNVVYGEGDQENVDSAIYADNSLIANNIVMNWPGRAIAGNGLSNVRHNLCFQNETDCGTEQGNLDSDPRFVDTGDFRLADDSPAIDAGLPMTRYRDLDGSATDLGIHGGPWFIEQYDVLRTESGPKVYPLFDPSSSQAVGSTLSHYVLGVVRAPGNLESLMRID